MEPRASHIFIGSFVIAAAIAVVSFVVWLAKSDIEAEVDRYTVEFRESVTGLSVGAEVRYSGIPVGKVLSIELNDKDAALVDVVVEISAKTPISKGTKASMALQGITGLAFIQLKGGTRGGKKLRAGKGQPYPVIPSTPSAIAQLFSDVPELMANLLRLSRDLSGFLSPENRKSVRNILRNSETFTAELGGNATAALKDLGSAARELAALASPENRAALTRILKNSDALTTKFGARADDLLQGLVTLLADFHRLAGPENQKALGKILSNTSKLMARFEAHGPEMVALVTEMSKTTVQLRQTIKNVDVLVGQWDKVGSETTVTIGLAQGMLKNADKILVGDVRKTFASLRSSVQKVNGLVSQFESLAAKNGAAVDMFTSDGLIEMIRFLEDARRLVNNANRLLDDLGSDPTKLLFGNKRGGIKVDRDLSITRGFPIAKIFGSFVHAKPFCHPTRTFRFHQRS